jgi:hypothetical protein
VIWNNALRCTVNNVHYSGVISRFELNGNFDITVDYDMVSSLNDDIDTWGAYFEARIDGENYARVYNRGDDTVYVAEFVKGGVLTSTLVDTVDPSGSFRIKRDGGWWRLYWKDFITVETDAFSQPASASFADEEVEEVWVLIGDPISVGTNNATVRIYAQNYDDFPARIADFDNFNVVSVDDFICMPSSSSSSTSSATSDYFMEINDGGDLLEINDGGDLLIVGG